MLPKGVSWFLIRQVLTNVLQLVDSKTHILRVGWVKEHNKVAGRGQAGLSAYRNVCIREVSELYSQRQEKQVAGTCLQKHERQKSNEKPSCRVRNAEIPWAAC